MPARHCEERSNLWAIQIKKLGFVKWSNIKMRSLDCPL